jgi:tetratricopeptide (TPR) repeat protein
MIIKTRRLVGLVAFVMAAFPPAWSLGMAQTAPSPRSQSAAREDLTSIRQYLENNQTTQALEAANGFAFENAGHPEALFQLASLLAAHSQHARAAALFARVNELRPHAPEVLYNLGVAYYHCQLPNLAVEALAESADLDGKPAETHFSLALLASERGDHENAILELQHATARAPGRADYQAQLGQEFSRVGYFQGAAARYRQAAAIEPAQALHRLHLGDALLRSQDLAPAIDAFQEAARLDPLLPEIDYLIGFACQNNGQFEKAREFYKRQLAKDPEHLESLVGLGTVAVEQGQFAEAEKLLQAGLAHDPDHVQANYELGLTFFKTRQFDRAIEALKRVLWLRPDHTQGEYYLYLALSRSHQAAASESAFSQWKKLEVLDRKVRMEEVAYEMARAARWTGQAASGN